MYENDYQAHYSAKDIAIVQAIGTFKYLTAKQMAVYGLSTKRDNLYANLNKLIKENAPLIAKKHLWLVKGLWQLDALYYLTHHGEAFLIDERLMKPDHIKRPRGNRSAVSALYKDYVYTIDCHIACRKWCERVGFYVERFDYCFDKRGSNHNNHDARLQSVTKIELAAPPFEGMSFVPDAIALLYRDQRPFLLLFEVYADHSQQRPMSKILKCAQALREWSVSLKYRVNYAARMVFVFQSRSNMLGVMKRCCSCADIQGFEDFFVFKTIGDVMNDFYAGWRLWSGKPVELIHSKHLS